MRETLTSKGRDSKLALIALVAALGIGSVAVPAVAAAAAPAAQADANRQPSEWAPASELGDSGKAPSLTTDIEQLDDGAGSQLWLGYGLVGAGLLALAFGLAAGVGKPRGGTGPVRRSRHQPGQTASPGENARASLPGR